MDGLDPAGHALRQALRKSSLFTRSDHVACLRVAGPEAHALLQRVSSAPLFQLDGQMRPTLFLHDDGGILADVIIARDDRDYFVLAEGPSGTALTEWLSLHGARPNGLDAAVEDLGRQHELLAVDGPFAWEVVAGVLGPEVIGVPYMSFYRARGVVCFRAGKTGEYGYQLLVPRADADTLVAELRAVGAPLGMREGSLRTLDDAALENWFFSLRHISNWSGQALTPVELQLQWRVGREREFPGAAAVKARRAAPLGRVTCFTADLPCAAGNRVTYNDQPVGVVLALAPATIGGGFVGVALLDLAYAHAGIVRYRVATESGAVPIATRTPPILANRSLFVDPHRHSAKLHGDADFPPLLPSVPALAR